LSFGHRSFDSIPKTVTDRVARTSDVFQLPPDSVHSPSRVFESRTVAACPFSGLIDDIPFVSDDLAESRCRLFEIPFLIDLLPILHCNQIC
jgi:hypothetical protein